MNKEEFIKDVPLGKLMIIAHEVTNNTKHDVFVRYSGHVNDIEIDIHINGWINDDELYSNWLDYRDKQKTKHKRYESFEKYSEPYKMIRYKINLESRTNSTIKILNDCIQQLEELLN